MIYFYLKELSSDRVRSADPLIIFGDGCGGENKKCTVCAFLRDILQNGLLPHLKLITVIWIEVCHSKFRPDAGFRLIRRCSHNYDTETIPDIVQMINASIPFQT